MFQEDIAIDGELCLYEIPPHVPLDALTRMWPFITESERDRYLVWQSSNFITTAGKTTILTFAGANTSSAQPWMQFIAFGTKGNVQAQASITQLGNEIGRFPTNANIGTVVGTQVVISFTIPANSAIASQTLSEAGLFGLTATGTLTSGTLMTYSTMNQYTTTSNAYIASYLINIT